MSKQTRDRFLPYVFDFLVVVLGVTVSFGLDSWRTDRQQAQLHAQDIRSLLEDLERDQERIQEVEEHIKLGQESFDKILRITNKHRRGEMEYADFAAQLMELGTPYVYLTFYMNNSTYKSLLSNGRLQNVKVGDRLDGGRVAAIGEDELRLTKSGRNIVLRVPRG